MKHPNAAAGLAGGSGGGVLAIYLLSLAGVHLPPLVEPVVGGIAAGLVLFLGRNGLRGALRVIWKGQG